MTRRRAHLEVLEDGEVGKHLSALGDVTDARFADAMARPAGDVGPVEDHTAVGRLLDSVDGADQRSLAGAVSADDGDDLARRDGERDPGEGLGVAVIEVQALDGEQGRAHAISCSPR
jgi:hypothetical protein